MRVADSPCHCTEVRAVDEDGHTQRVNGFLDKLCDQVCGAFLILKTAGEVSCDPRQLGQSEYFLIRNVPDGDAHDDRKKVVLTQTDLVYPLDDDHVVADRLPAFSLELFC